MTPTEKRTTDHARTLPPTVTDASRSHCAPLGARHEAPPPPAAGGGSRDECNGSDFDVRPARDARIDELRRSGVGRVWLTVADAIGYEAFLVVWRTLAAQPEVADERHRVYVPRWHSFLRYQRNLLVRTLARSGATPEEIQAAVAKEVGEMMSRTHVCRLVKAAENEA